MHPGRPSQTTRTGHVRQTAPVQASCSRLGCSEESAALTLAARRPPRVHVPSGSVSLGRPPYSYLSARGRSYLLQWCCLRLHRFVTSRLAALTKGLVCVGLPCT